MKFFRFSLLIVPLISLFSACDPGSASNPVAQPINYTQRDVPGCLERQKDEFQKSDLKLVNNLSDLLDILLQNKSNKNQYSICSVE